MHEDLDDTIVHILESDAFIRLFPASVVGSAEVLGVVADEVLVDFEDRLLGTDYDLYYLSCSSVAVPS